MHNPCRDARTIKLTAKKDEVLRGLQKINNIRMGLCRIANWIIWDLQNTSWSEYALDCNLGKKQDH